MLEENLKNKEVNFDLKNLNVSNIKEIIKNHPDYKLVTSATERLELIQKFIFNLQKE